MPSLPLHFWSEDVFQWIGNALDIYMDYDKSYMLTGNISMACILVHLDTAEDLKENMQLDWRDTCRVHILDYERVPYRCRRCHNIGHLYKDLPLLASSSALVAQSEQAAVNLDSDQRGKALTHFEENTQMGSLETQRTHKEQTHPPSPHITRSRVAAVVDNSIVVPSLTLHLSIYCHLHIFLALCFVMFFLCIVLPLFAHSPHLLPFYPPLHLPSVGYQIHSPLRNHPLNLVRDMATIFGLCPA